MPKQTVCFDLQQLTSQEFKQAIYIIPNPDRQGQIVFSELPLEQAKSILAKLKECFKNRKIFLEWESPPDSGQMEYE